MKQMITFAAVGVALTLACTTQIATAMTVDTDKFSVTMPDEAVKGSNAKFSGLWIGDVTRDGKTDTWIELTDLYGEVVYTAVVHANETHVLPGGHTITIRERGEKTVVSTKKFTDRVAPDAKRIATERIVMKPKHQASVATEAEPAPSVSNPAATLVQRSTKYTQGLMKLMVNTLRGVRVAWM